MWEKRREMRSGNLFTALSRRQTEEIILSLSGNKLVSVQDGAAMGRKLIELTCMCVRGCGRVALFAGLKCLFTDGKN